MATQFYFKRKWLDTEELKGWLYSDYIRSLFYSAVTQENNLGICTIKSEFYLMHNSSQKALCKVLDEIGFRVVKFRNIRIPYFTGTFVKILPYPYTDKRCRKKEL